jgi:serine protease Do
VRRRLNGPGREEQRTRSLNTYGCLLQTDARLTLGSSGGGLFNISGELIGLTTSLAAVTAADSSGGFAIPLDVNYRRIIDTLVRGQEVEYGFLGVQVSSTPLDRETQGLRLLSVTPGTPAADAGLIADNLGRIGDIILKIDDNPIIEQDDLFLYLGAALAGTRVKITVRDSNGNVRVVPVTLAKYGHAQPWIASNRPPAVFGLRVEYSSVLLLQMQMAGDQRAMIQGLPSGVVVRELDPGSIAEQRFKALGVPVSRWVIREVNGKPISNPTEFYNETRSKKSVTLTLVDPTSQQSDRQITLP